MEGKWLALFAICLFLGGCAAAGGFPAQTVEETNKIPVVVLADEDHDSKAVELGAAAVVSKPAASVLARSSP